MIKKLINAYDVHHVVLVWDSKGKTERKEFYPAYNFDDIRTEIQIRISKYLDFRTWKSGDQRVEWDNILEIVKSTPGVKYVPDEYFYPNIDIFTDKNKIPRLRGFIMMDLNGSLISGITNQFNPVYYPKQADFSYQQTVLRNI